MKGRFLVSSNEDPAEGNIYADRSALILDWLLREGIKRQGFSLREVAKKIEVSVGLVQRVFGILILKGLLQTEGIRTAKKFFFKKPKLLLESWLEHYSISKKCKMRTYHSALAEKAEFLLSRSPISKHIIGYIFWNNLFSHFLYIKIQIMFFKVIFKRFSIANSIKQYSLIEKMTAHLRHSFSFRHYFSFDFNEKFS